MNINLSQKELRAFLVPGGVLISVLILAVISGRIILNRIGNLRQEIAAAAREENALAEKVNVLQSLSPATLGQTQISTVALPSKNSALLAISQIKIKAQVFGINLDEIKVGGQLNSGTTSLSRAEISFDGVGQFASVADFLISLSGTAPLGRVEAVKISQAGETTRATITYSSFWADFPDKLPSLTESLPDLTSEEEATLRRLLSLDQPTFSELNPSAPIQRANPFSF
ncbi:MAG: hypothetical protein UW21_C0007G0009 [Candidatus Woesebacteria bacterium GW2011_GWB1_44_11b]|uniref:Uncharacterized protein n=1 Tax=Candidatus Woesebacteria bacterium GW2011_GWB1_44_11b TaxID=1618580 RepID=A0A0G1IPY8_9BACT|nr:MAG: hypothetical protein UW21_C0007G0009 [Candidatus Woesebacteria bacterium GW2011_GWB1_44_11b]